MIRAIFWGAAVALFLQFGLEPTGWLFYELSHATGIDALYHGYSLFRGGGYMYHLWPWHLATSIAAGLVVGLCVAWWRNRRRRV
jgi:hypothetical protein